MFPVPYSESLVVGIKIIVNKWKVMLSIRGASGEYYIEEVEECNYLGWAGCQCRPKRLSVDQAHNNMGWGTFGKHSDLINSGKKTSFLKEGADLGGRHPSPN